MNRVLDFAHYRLMRWSALAVTALITLALIGGGAAAVEAAPLTTPGGDTPPEPGGEQAGSAAPLVQQFEDVPDSNTFAGFINSLYLDTVISGYPCGGAGEPCVAPGNRPYYRPNNDVTRGQMAKFVDNGRHLPGISITTSDLAYQNGTIIATNNGAPGTTGAGAYAINARTYARSGSRAGDVDNINAGAHFYGAGNGTTGGSVGLVAHADHDNAAWFESGVPDDYGGIYVRRGGLIAGHPSVTGPHNVTIFGNLTVTGAKVGYVVDIMRNTGPTELQPGEVVAMTAAAQAALLGDIPLPSAGAAVGAYNPSVVGVVDQRWIPADPTAPEGSEASAGRYEPAARIRPGEYMGVVTLGAYKGVRVDATNSPIHVGDLLVSSPTTGTAMKATDKLDAIGAVIGKAMGDLPSGTGTIPVLVTLK
jgi:hypothetical protein